MELRFREAPTTATERGERMGCIEAVMSECKGLLSYPRGTLALLAPRIYGDYTRSKGELYLRPAAWPGERARSMKRG